MDDSPPCTDCITGPTHAQCEGCPYANQLPNETNFSSSTKTPAASGLSGGLGVCNECDKYRGALQKLLAAKDATTNYMSRIPDGCSAEPAYLGRLVRKETEAEDAARKALADA